MATGAVRLLLDWAFTVRRHPLVHWRANVGNWGSRRVAWATGFHFGSTIPKLLVQRGERHDAWTGWIGADDDRTPTTVWLETPVLETERVRLRLWRDDEAERYASARTNEATAHFLPIVRQPFGIDHARRVLLQTREQATLGDRLTWCVADSRTDLALGNLTVFRLDDEWEEGAEVGYWAHADAHRRGVMSEALQTVTAWCYAPVDAGGLGLTRLVVVTAATNTASRRLAEKAGFELVGTERRAFRLGDGTIDDQVVYDLLADQSA